MNKSGWIVDEVDFVNGDVSQVGETCSTYEEARKLFVKTLKEKGFFDDWDGISCIYSTTDTLVVVREIKLP